MAVEPGRPTPTDTLPVRMRRLQQRHRDAFDVDDVCIRFAYNVRQGTPIIEVTAQLRLVVGPGTADKNTRMVSRFTRLVWSALPVMVPNTAPKSPADPAAVAGHALECRCQELPGLGALAMLSQSMFVSDKQLLLVVVSKSNEILARLQEEHSITGTEQEIGRILNR